MISFCGWWSQMRSSLHPFSPVPVSAHDVLGKAAAPRKRHPPCPPLKGGRKKWITLTLVYKCCPGLTSHGYPSPALPELISCQVFSILSPLLPPHSLCPFLTQPASFSPVAKACSYFSLQSILCTGQQNRRLWLCFLSTQGPFMAPHCSQSKV